MKIFDAKENIRFHLPIPPMLTLKIFMKVSTIAEAAPCCQLSVSLNHYKPLREPEGRGAPEHLCAAKAPAESINTMVIPEAMPGLACG